MYDIGALVCLLSICTYLMMTCVVVVVGGGGVVFALKNHPDLSPQHVFGIHLLN